MRKNHYIIGLLVFFFSQNWVIAQTAQSAQAEQKAVAPIKTIASLDVARYQGTWYEIAKFPNSCPQSLHRYRQAQVRA